MPLLSVSSCASTLCKKRDNLSFLCSLRLSLCRTTVLLRWRIAESRVKAMGIEMDDPPDQMSLKALEERCQQEMLNYRKGEVYDDRYCLEIFYRALKKQDNQASELLIRSFRSM